MKFLHVRDEFLKFLFICVALFSEMARLSNHEQTKLVQLYLQTGSLVQTKRKFRSIFGPKNTPSHHTISRLTQNFIASGTTWEQPRTGRKSVITSNHIADVKKIVEETPTISIRRLAQQVNLTNSATYRVLRKKLKLRAYKIPIVQSLSNEARAQRKTFCKWFLQKCASRSTFLQDIWWSDEAHVYLHGDGNRQNVRIWSRRPPDAVCELPLHSPKVTVWCALSAQGIIGPIFFEDGGGNTVTVNQERYQEVILQFVSALQRRCADTLNVQWFQQDGAPAHTAKKTLELLRARMEDRVISRGADVGWPPQSPDRSPPDFFLWGHIKAVVFKNDPKDLSELKEAIRAAVGSITQETCAKVAEEAKRRATLCVARNGGHVENA